MGLGLWSRHLGSLPHRQCNAKSPKKSSLCADWSQSFLGCEGKLSKANHLFKMFQFCQISKC